MADLRDEIVESQKIRADFLKWKLIIVASLGGAGLGLTGQTTGAAFGYAYLVLTLVPFVCVYVDLLCRHNSLRIQVIGAFLRSGGDKLDSDYERFVASRRQELNVFKLEDWVLQYSTTALSALVGVVGMLMLSRGPAPGATEGNRVVLSNNLIGWMFTGSGAAGIGLSYGIERLYKRISDALKTRLEQ